MFTYLLKKTARLLIVLIGVSILTFSLTSWIQGNPAEIVMSKTGIDPTIEEIKALEIKMGMNQSIPTQYMKWLGNVVKLDFGESYITGLPVLEEISYRVPSTVRLTLASFFLMLIISINVGVLSVILRNSFVSTIIDGCTFIIMGVPGFVFGLVVSYFMSVKFNLLPMIGNSTLAHYILPALTLAIPLSSRYIRIIKSNMLEVLDEDFIFLLRTKGIRERVIMFSHALKNAFIPVVNLMGISLGNLFGGSVIVESIFSWPGLGSYLITSINNRDYPVILAYVLIMAIVFVVINYLVDILVGFLDPRIKFAEGK